MEGEIQLTNQRFHITKARKRQSIAQIQIVLLQLTAVTDPHLLQYI